MIEGFVRYANTKTGNSIIDKSITKFKYDNLDLICIYENDTNIEIDTIAVVKQNLGINENEEISLEELKDLFIAYRNGDYTLPEKMADNMETDIIE